MVLNIEGGLLDSLGFVKDDFLIVDVVGLINEFYSSINRRVPTFNELKELVKDDKETWDIYAKGATCCINQVEKTGSTMKVMKYKPQNIAELSMFIAAIRPGFASLIDNFLARKYYTTGQKEIDQVLNDTNHYMIYQESIMKLLGFLGLPMSDTYGVVKAISKKKLKGEKKEKLLGKLKESWRDKFGDTRKFDSVWQVISDSARYNFNCSHAYSMAGDSLYGAYFKAHYPDKFYEVAMNHYHKKNNKNKIFDLESEAKKFYGYNVAPMRYGQNNVKFSVAADKKAIYSPLDSIKDIGMNAAEDMAKISDKHYQSFVDIIASCKGTKVNSKVIGKLLDIDYFEKFGTSKYLSKKYELVKQFYGKKQLSKADYDMSELIKDTGDSVITDLMKSGKRSDKRYQIVDNQKLIEYMSKSIPKEDFSIGEKIKRQYEALGFTDVTNEGLDWRFAVVTGINDKYSVKVDLYCVNNGKTTTFKVRKTKGRDVDIKTTWNQCTLQMYDMIHIDGCKKQKKMTQKDGKWVPSGDYEWVLTEYSVVA